MRAGFSAPVQTGPGAHPASCKMSIGSFPGVKSGLGVTLTPHPLLVPWSRKSRAVPVLPLWAVRPVQNLSACTRVTFTFTFLLFLNCWQCGSGSSVRIATELRAGRSGIESRWERVFPPAQTYPGAHPASCKLGIGSFPGERAAVAYC